MVATGTLFVIAAPSGTGKTTLVKALTEKLPNIQVSISHTTRQKRPNEVNHAHYHFVDQDTFQNMIAHNDFLEYATIFDQHYGTSKTWVEQTLEKGCDVILEIDWQGYQQIKRLMPQSIGIFILPPSLQDLKNRLSSRKQDHAHVIQERLDDAKKAASHANEFNYIVVNDDFSHAISDLTHIIKASRLTLSRQTIQLVELIKELT
ncbi:MAG: guanylate kinase [Gammaproteobacteria bacterium RIFCSPHIGHO2_12_FULL_42_10]|nr:MAG: guanylate kinase [Gammaproteobacteria bacterium RIFCSPHIGHO2_12_FULL_42_10]